MGQYQKQGLLRRKQKDYNLALNYKWFQKLREVD
jgi:hypothetical protein